MINRFSLYGFLKNQQYYEPFLLLAFLQMGLSYTTIGLLIGFRALVVNLLEIPSGAIADIWGRRRSLLLSFTSYIIHFAMVGFAGLAALKGRIPQGNLTIILFLSMVFFALGDAFRTGTHKALIFTWLRLEGQTHRKTEVYGHTRSWSKIGSAVSVLLACLFVYLSDNYIYIFFFSIFPYLLNLINVGSYPKELEGAGVQKAEKKQFLSYLKDTFTLIFQRASLRRLFLESMGFEGFFSAAKDYLQPILKLATIPLGMTFFSQIAMTEVQQSVILIGPVFFFLYMVSALASRKAHSLEKKMGGEDSAAQFLWLVLMILMVIMIPALYFGSLWIIIAGFILLYTIQNLWRPILISRIDSHSNEAKGATLLSVESQAKSGATMILAPLLGGAIDFAHIREIGLGEFWPIGIVGFILSAVFYLTGKKRANMRGPM